MKRCLFTVSVACALLATFGPASAADLNIWWEEGYYPEEDKAIGAVINDFEQASGKDVELTLYPQQELPGKVASAVEAGRPPDLVYSLPINYEQLAYDDALADVTDIIEPIKDTFFPAALQAVLLRDGKTGQRAYYGVPIGQSTAHIHVWRSLLDEAGIQLQDIPKEWEPFWAFWCDTVQPAVREGAGRNDIYGVGLTMSDESNDTGTNFWMFVNAHEADYVTRDGKLVIDDPDVQAKLVTVLNELATIYRKSCTPPDSVNWNNPDNNKQFHAQRIVMTVNDTLSITNALRADRPDDYYKNTVTIQWPNGLGGKPPAIENSVYPVLVFKDARKRCRSQGVSRLSVERGAPRRLHRGLSRPGPAAHAGTARDAVLARRRRPAPHRSDQANPGRPVGLFLRRGLRQRAPWRDRSGVVRRRSPRR
jgi:multiple sugar transport system substrate-binding protein